MTKDKSWRTLFVSSAQRELRAIPQSEALRILKRLGDLQTNPRGFDTVELVGDADCRRLRVGKYRVIYMIQNEDVVILVVIVGKRGDVYDGVHERLSRIRDQLSRS